MEAPQSKVSNGKHVDGADAGNAPSLNNTNGKADGMTLRQLAEAKSHPNSMLAHRMLESHMAKLAVAAMLLEYYELGMSAKDPEHKTQLGKKRHGRSEHDTCEPIYGTDSAPKRRLKKST